MAARYGHLESLAIRFTLTEAWVFSTSAQAWKTLHPAEAVENGSPLTKAEFDKMFPKVPPLPAEAFKD